jgi:K+/H+ antiporter YhaU regulatory subunit KhtT
VLDQLMGATKDLEVGWLLIEEGSSLAGVTLAESALRARTGVSVVAIGRGADVIRNPTPSTPPLAGDHLAVIGTQGQIDETTRLVEAGPSGPAAPNAGSQEPASTS